MVNRSFWAPDALPRFMPAGNSKPPVALSFVPKQLDTGDIVGNQALARVSDQWSRGIEAQFLSSG
jgi:hypothetical protein